MSFNDRLFKMPEAHLLQHAEMVASMYPTDVVDFSAFDSTFTIDYAATIKNSINAVTALKSDQVVIDQMAEHTQHVLDAMGTCNSDYKTVAYFVRKAFKNNKAVQNQFGFNDIEKARSSQPKMILFMEEHAGTAAEHKVDLIAQGCNALLIDKLIVDAQNLKEANTKQEKFKKERGVITQDRVNLLNKVYLLVKPLSEIAQIIYNDDAARLAKYSLPKPKSSQNSADDLIES
jgi:hypothetical protein